MIDLNVRLDAYDEPHQHFRGAGLVSPADLAVLNASAPDETLFERIEKSSPDARRRYRSSVLPLLDDEKEITPDPALLAPSWQRLAADLLSADFADWIRRETGVDTTGLRRTCAIFRHYDGDYQDLNTGKLHKRMHVELHVNDNWPSDGGGEWEFWAGPDRSAGPRDTMLPIGGTTLLYSASKKSWHQMVPVSPGRGLVRLWVSLSFFGPAEQ
jgi:hypothetical protein